jgi:DNA-binding SARP family transcriptional activator
LVEFVHGNCKHVKLYRNDFLIDDLYNELINSKRETYRQQYRAILNSLAGIHENRGALKKSANIYRKILKIDPISETTCQKLMLNLSSRGKRNDAVRLYEKFKRILKEKVDTEPDLLTSNIYSKILDTGKQCKKVL